MQPGSTWTQSIYQASEHKVLARQEPGFQVTQHKYEQTTKITYHLLDAKSRQAFHLAIKRPLLNNQIRLTVFLIALRKFTRNSIQAYQASYAV